MKLNVGCGAFCADGWVNVDRWTDLDLEGRNRAPDVAADGHQLPFAAGAFRRVYVGHVLEHVPLAGCAALFAELRRCMRPGASIVVAGPDVADEAVAVFWRTREAQGEAWPDPSRLRDDYRERDDWQPWAWFWAAHKTNGTGVMYPADRTFRDGVPHLWNCTREAAWLMLSHAGYTQIEERALRDLAGDDWPIVAPGSPGQFAWHAVR